MALLKNSDFYYGAVLSHLFNHRICPMLVEGGDNRQIYEFTTNNSEFILFVKYRSLPIATKNEDYNSWQFVFSDADMKELTAFLNNPKQLSVGLICGNKALGKSEVAFIHKEELQELFDAGKTTLTISRKKNERCFRISIGGGRDQALKIESKRIY